jgi:hypothetical protein
VKYALFALTVIFVISSAAHSAIVIDDFSTGPSSLVATSGQRVNAYQGPLPTASVAGGYRQIAFGVPSTPAGTIETDVDTVKRRLLYTSSVSSGTGSLSAINFRVVYNGNSSTTPGMDLNLAADGSNALALNFEFANFNGGYGHLDIALGSATGGEYVYQLVPNSVTPLTVYVPFHDPNASSGGPPLDPTDVKSIYFGSSNGNLPGPGSFAIDSITTATVPEPTGLVIDKTSCLPV